MSDNHYNLSNKMTENNTSIDINSQAVHLHLKMHQDIIKRMALNSLFIKTCFISLLFLSVTTSVILSGFGCLLLTVAFAIMDTKYLARERGFRASYNNFVKKLHSNTLQKEDVFVLTPEPICFWYTAKSFSVYLFYVVPICFYVFVFYLSPICLLLDPSTIFGRTNRLFLQSVNFLKD